QAALVPDGGDLMPLVRAAGTRYEAGEPMNPDPSLPETVRMVLASFEAPANLPLARELWSESATAALRQINIPTLVLVGGQDVQVDPVADGTPLEQAAAENTNVTFAYPTHANHVFKEDTRSPAEAAAPGTGYNEDGTHLDPEALRTILEWLARV